MNKAKKSDPKKILVRNTELPVPKTKVIIKEKPDNKVKKKIEAKTQVEKPKPKFNRPELNSALNIAKKIDVVEKTKSEKFKKVPDVALCEKITRKINFPADKYIYKDLIPLQVPKKPPPILSSREPLPHKDREPVLSDYFKPPEPKEYIYHPSIKLDQQSTQPQLNNLRLYKFIRMHDQ